MNTVYWVLVAFGIVVLEARLRARNVRYLPILPAIVLGAVLSKVTYVVLQWHYAFPRWSWGAFTVFQPDTFCFFGGAVGVVPRRVRCWSPLPASAKSIWEKSAQRALRCPNSWRSSPLP